jgi:AmiR/NasT family two-component response regulator
MTVSVNGLSPRSTPQTAVKQQMGMPLRIALADRDGVALDRLRQMLKGYGHEVVVACQNVAALLRGCREHHPDLVVVEMEMAGPGPSGSLAELVCQICDGRDIPVIAVSTSCTQEDMEEAKFRSCVAHLIKPLTEQSLVATISLSIYHFEVLAAVCRELADLRNTVESRKMVDRAKGILMKRAGMSETQAHARLQELASSRNMKMPTVADLIVEAELAFSKTIS